MNNTLLEEERLKLAAFSLWNCVPVAEKLANIAVKFAREFASTICNNISHLLQNIASGFKEQKERTEVKITEKYSNVLF